MWPYLAIFRHFGTILLLLGNVLRIYFVFGKPLNLLWQFLNVIRLICIDVNGQMLKNNLAIWSHWPNVGGILVGISVVTKKQLRFEVVGELFLDDFRLLLEPFEGMTRQFAKFNMMRRRNNVPRICCLILKSKSVIVLAEELSSKKESLGSR